MYPFYRIFVGRKGKKNIYVARFLNNVTAKESSPLNNYLQRSQHEN